MKNFDIVVETKIPDTYRVNRTKSLFNVEEAHGARHRVQIEIPLEGKDWRIGAVIGPSGSGKTTLGKRILGVGAYHKGFHWGELPIIEEIGKNHTYDEVTGALSAVGLGSVPSWLRPFKVLSTGEKFRAELARMLIETEEDIVVDEFTSVVDRQIAKIGAGAFGKAWRRKPQGRVVVLSPHYDILEWLQPDWIVDSESWTFEGRCLRRTPSIQVDLFQTNWKPWPLFEKHHYLKLNPMIAAINYVGLVEGEPVVHVGVSTFNHVKTARLCRLVVLPEWQGAGVGMKFLEAVAQMWLEGENRYRKRMTSVIHTSHPGLCGALRRSKKWHYLTGRLLGEKTTYTHVRKNRGYGGHLRAVQGFRYIGEPRAAS